MAPFPAKSGENSREGDLAGFFIKLDIDHLLNDLESIFKDIKIISFYLSQYKELDPDNPIEAKLEFFFAYKEGKRIPIGDKKIICPVKKLVPDIFLPKTRRFLIIIEPLFTGARQFGCAFMELPVHREIISNMMLRTLLYNTLRNTLFIQKLQEQSENLHPLALAAMSGVGGGALGAGAGSLIGRLDAKRRFMKDMRAENPNMAEAWEFYRKNPEHYDKALQTYEKHTKAKAANPSYKRVALPKPVVDAAEIGSMADTIKQHRKVVTNQGKALGRMRGLGIGAATGLGLYGLHHYLNSEE